MDGWWPIKIPTKLYLHICGHRCTLIYRSFALRMIIWIVIKIVCPVDDRLEFQPSSMFIFLANSISQLFALKNDKINVFKKMSAHSKTFGRFLTANLTNWNSNQDLCTYFGHRCTLIYQSFARRMIIWIVIQIVCSVDDQLEFQTSSFFIFVVKVALFSFLNWLAKIITTWIVGCSVEDAWQVSHNQVEYILVDKVALCHEWRLSVNESQWFDQDGLLNIKNKIWQLIVGLS